MKTLTAVTDPCGVEKPASAIDYFLINFLNDERDLPFIYLTIKISLVLIPVGVLLYLPFISGWLWWLLAFTYLVLNNAMFKGPFGLMFHCTNHRPLFKSPYRYWNNYLPWVVGPFFGQSPETYYSHHIGMHHVEGNMTEDESSTLAYKRDSVRSFLKYYGLFMVAGVIDLIDYLLRKKRRKLVCRAVVGEVSFLALCVGLSFISFPATLVVFIIPLFIYRLIAMVGNWTQHSFVDASEPANPYKNSITCINVKYNHKCWNDGYHISHHERPAMHWSEYPNHFLKTQAKYRLNKAIVFDGLDYSRVFFYLMCKRYDVLARHLLNIDNAFASEQEAIALLKERTKPILS
ncbi:fatty acid desaturase family protein [Rufibacter tibetensis]|uniref:Fatty acid desaturase n=1 Tax=Rufibacter tibetensis TaxID=512763 RepID=A0A0P0CLJ6_9BACT|nr:fatty acid desaturase [Rufibacter tibetensis]ALI97695.1 fatty acid desaturase [Rufibacter tibetensis]